MDFRIKLPDLIREAEGVLWKGTNGIQSDHNAVLTSSPDYSIAKALCAALKKKPGVKANTLDRPRGGEVLSIEWEPGVEDWDPTSGSEVA